jgi:hypothetical protein
MEEIKIVQKIVLKNAPEGSKKFPTKEEYLNLWSRSEWEIRGRVYDLLQLRENTSNLKERCAIMISIIKLLKEIYDKERDQKVDEGINDYYDVNFNPCNWDDEYDLNDPNRPDPNDTEDPRNWNGHTD